ncbi:MAG: hypothetical protein A4E57_02173 [Syntrophorhabdaceae bacterium PtaU1.Bin034]|nr:MAG: hypothetical protein A4E57_02173 [Syntrophorhabdaceae bacterium PtaU1.Bin034]
MYKPQLADRVRESLYPIPLQGVQQRLEYSFPGLLPLHVNEIDNNDATHISQSYLVGDLLHGFKVGTQYGILQPPLPQILPRVDIDDGQCLRIIKYYVATRFQPDFLVRKLGDLYLDPVKLEYILFLVKIFNLAPFFREIFLQKLVDLFIQKDIVGYDPLQIMRVKIPYHPVDELQVLMQYCRRPYLLCLLLDALPHTTEKIEISPELILLFPFACGPRDQPEPFRANVLQYGRQPLPFTFVFDPP